MRGEDVRRGKGRVCEGEEYVKGKEYVKDEGV